MAFRVDICRSSFGCVQGLLHRSSNVDSALARYFPADGITYFRRVQRVTGTLIGGSMALQLFLHVVYPDSDLNLYDNQYHAEDLMLALETRLGCRRLPRAQDMDEDGRHHLYLACSVEEVDDFELPFGHKVQVITTKSAPVQSMLGMM